MEPEGSLPYSQVPATYPYPEPTPSKSWPTRLRNAHVWSCDAGVTVTIKVFWYVTSYCLVGGTKVSGAPDADIFRVEY